MQKPTTEEQETKLTTKRPVGGGRQNSYVHTLKGTLSYNLDLGRHVIRGIWNYHDSTAFLPQRFELLRTLEKDEDPKELPKDGEFHGSFGLAYYHTTSKGKQKERKKVILEHGVKIAFTKIKKAKEEEEDNQQPSTCEVNGKGMNKFGIFHINGTATPSQQEEGADPTYDVIFRKWYEPGGGGGGGGGSKKRKRMAHGSSIGDVTSQQVPPNDPNNGPLLLLPPPSKIYPKRVVCFRGTLSRDEEIPADDEELGIVHHRIRGMWSSGLDLILSDPQNTQGLCNQFEFECKSSSSSATATMVPTRKSEFPLSGQYSGWFNLKSTDSEEGGKQQRTTTTIKEQRLNLRFIKNSAGYHNVEGSGFSNAFGRCCSITGTLTADNVITIFRHYFKSRKAQSSVSTPVPPLAIVAEAEAAAAKRPQPTTITVIDDHQQNPRREEEEGGQEEKAALEDDERSNDPTSSDEVSVATTVVAANTSTITKA